MQSSKKIKKPSQNTKGVLRLIAFSVVAVLLFTLQSGIFHPKDGKDASGYTKNITAAYRAEEKDVIDVVVIGNSNAYRAFNPIVLWEEHRITSCSIGAPMMRVDQVYRYVRDVFKTQSPKVIALETNCFYDYFKQENTQDKPAEENPRTAQVEKPAAQSKYRPGILNYDVNELNDQLISLIAYNAALMKYHDRWRSLTAYDFTHLNRQYYYVTKGYHYSSDAKPYEGGADYMGEKNAPPQEAAKFNKFYFDKIYKLCKKHGAELTLITAPCAQSWNYSRHNYMQQLADEYSITFVDYNTVDAGINWSIDTKDAGTHMNVFGANKVSRAYGNLLVDKFGLAPSILTNKQKNDWNNDAKRYHNEVEDI